MGPITQTEDIESVKQDLIQVMVMGNIHIILENAA